MDDQSVLDIKFKDVLARDLKSVLGKTLDELVKDLVRSSKDALGVSGTMTNLGVIPDREGRISGIRFAVDSAVKDDVQKALRVRLGQLATYSGVRQIASVLSNTDVQAFSEPFIRLPNDEPAFAKSVIDFINSSGGEILGSENYEDYIALRARIPHSHIVGNKLSTFQQLNEYKRDAKNIISESIENKRIAAAAEAARKKDFGYVSEAELLSDEERRKKLGIVEEENTASEIEKTSFFNKSLIYLAGIGETVRRIFGVVSKLYDNALKASYTAQAANVDPDKLRALEYALQGFGFDRGVAGAAVGLISGGLMNPLQLNENLVDTLAPVMGKSTAEMVNEMLLGGGDTLSALTMIMEAARKKVAAGGMTKSGDPGKAFSEVFGQLKTAGGSLELMFQAYMKAVEKANKQGWEKFTFSDFLSLFPAEGTDISADAALQKYFLGAKVKAGAENTVYGATYEPGTTYRNFAWKGNPFKTEEGFLKALNSFGYSAVTDDDIFKLEPALKDLKASGAVGGAALEDLKRLLDTIADMRARKWQTNAPYWDTNGFALPFDIVSDKDAFLGPAVERAAQGFTGFLNSGGVNYFDYTTNNTASASAQEPGRMQMDMNLRINGKEAGVFPLEFGPDNFVVSGDITVAT